ncbi:PTS sugar transporter subunit IIB [Olsenella sp. HMSC062G07]|uniref:PTS sugar transporter subunit IIB n=1 Tax=Olsenella sp. HMSC062G07 TaxID=1739330 RepID=UPI0008A212F0|nr:PTS sugar transporter subunit IIB [Olsenella sp. HMSC062G07]OFK23358.1 PTS mannose transporter subunit EIIAB [Olsenella sp. HMSC062G07]
MTGIVLTSHGNLAKGVRDSLEMLLGGQDDLSCVTLLPSMSPDELRVALESAAAGLSDPDDVLLLVDLWGGTPFNQVSTLLADHAGWVLVTGLNLPMAIEACSSRDDGSSARELAGQLLVEGRRGVRVLPEDLVPRRASVPAPAPAAATKGGEGGLNIKWVRIDTRLLHGQVAMAWSKEIRPNRIIVVSDAVAHDELRKNLITQAAPPGIKANVCPVSKLVQLAGDPRFSTTSALLLFETPQDVVRAVEGGVGIGHVNVGSMAHSAGKVAINETVSIDADDARALKCLHDSGCELGWQKVPTDREEPIWPLVEGSGLLG